LAWMPEVGPDSMLSAQQKTRHTDGFFVDAVF
jgi:hypothetical protein